MRTSLLLCLFSLLWLNPVLAQKKEKTNFYDPTRIVEVRIQFADRNWEKLLDSLKTGKDDDRILADVTVDGEKFEKVGVRFKGNSSYYNVRNSGSNKLPFNLKCNFEIKGQKFPDKVETIKLSNGFRDPSFIREVLSYEIAGQYMPAPRANFVKLYVNGDYMGLYTSTESIDERFLDDHFDVEEGVFFKCDPVWGGKEKEDCPDGDKSSLMYLGDNPYCYLDLYEIKSDTGWTELIDLTRLLAESPERIEEMLDVDLTLWMLAFNMVVVNLDSYTGRLCHNYYLFRLPNGRFVPLIWDMNLSFGGFRFAGTGQALSNEELQTLSPFLHYKEKNPKRPLITQLLSNPLYRKIYLGHIRTILDDNFTNGKYLERGRELMALIDEEVKNDTNKLYTYEAFQQNLESTAKAGKSSIIGIAELMEPRIEYLRNHPVLAKAPPAISKVEAIEYGPTLAINAVVDTAEKAYLAYRWDPDDPFVLLEMFDDSSHNDEMSGDGIWGATLENKKGLQYYVIAEGDRSASLSPARASLEFYEY